MFIPDCPLILISVKPSQFVKAFSSIFIVSARHGAQNSGKAREKIKCFYILGQCADKFFYRGSVGGFQFSLWDFIPDIVIANSH